MATINLPEPLIFLEKNIKDLGFSGMGYAPSTKPLSFQKYQQWINDQNFGEMIYLKNHLAKKNNLKNIDPKINSIFSLTHPYRILTKENQSPFQHLKIAMYAQDLDYHDWLKEKLNSLCKLLLQFFPTEFFLPVTDIYPILERDFAFQTEQGWIGKNSCLIHPEKGSLFLIGNILSSLQFPNPKLKTVHDFCGKCQACIQACPTQAIQNDKTLQSDLCISYWTIESKNIPPEPIRKKMGSHFFGCDICQTVCPWNQKTLKNLLINNTQAVEVSNELISELRFVLTASNEQINIKTKNTALSRSKSFGLKRNALIVIANLKISELKTEVEKLKNDEKLAELSEWTLSELG